MNRLIKKYRQREFPMSTIRGILAAAEERATLVRKNKPIHGLAGIEDRHGETYLRDLANGLV